MQGIIVYSKVDSERNWWFIDEMKRLFKLNGVEINLVIEEELTFDILPDFVIYRGRHPEIVRQFENKGVRVFNNSKTNELANDKCLTYKYAESKGYKVLNTFDSIDNISKYPCVMKAVDGHGGKEVFLLKKKEDARPLDNKHYIYQEMCDDPGVDMRVYVIGSTPKIAIKRTSDKDFRSNYSLGGHAEQTICPKDVCDICQSISRDLQSDFIGIDFIRNNGQWVLNEIEDPVGCRMVYHCTKYDIIEDFVHYVLTKLGI